MSDLLKRSSKRDMILGLVGGYTLCIPETIREHIDENIYANISVKKIYENFTCRQSKSFLNGSNVL